MLISYDSVMSSCSIDCTSRVCVVRTQFSRIQSDVKEIHRYGICVTNDHENIVFVIVTIRSLPHSRLITGFVTRVIRHVPHVEQELFNHPEYISSHPHFSGVRVFFVMFCRSLLVILPFFFCSLYCISSFELRLLITPFNIFKLFSLAHF